MPPVNKKAKGLPCYSFSTQAAFILDSESKPYTVEFANDTTFLSAQLKRNANLLRNACLQQFSS